MKEGTDKRLAPFEVSIRTDYEAQSSTISTSVDHFQNSDKTPGGLIDVVRKYVHTRSVYSTLMGVLHTHHSLHAEYCRTLCSAGYGACTA